MDERERSLEEIFSRFAAEGEAAAAKARVPFKFLDPYEAEDREIFFGREEEVKELYRKYHSAPLLLIYGESGTGKTSLLRCGLLAQIPSSDVFLIHVRNSAAPLEALAAELACHPVDSFEGLLARDRVDKAPEPSHPIPVQQPLGARPGMTGTMLERLRALYRQKRKPITLLFDQFEELFIFRAEEERRTFLEEVAGWLASDIPIKVVLVIRQEYLARLTEFEGVLPSLFQNRVWVRKMDATQAEEAIAGPCRVCGVGIERELVQRLLKPLQAEGHEVELPDLQVLMDRLYKKAVERDAARPEIRLDDYEKLGRLENILADFLNEVVGALPDPELGKNILKLMVTAEGTKKAISEQEAQEWSLGGAGTPARAGGQECPPSRGETGTVLQAFERARIVRRRPDGLFELRHDALAKTIYRWMSETEKEILELRQLVTSRHEEYRKRGTLLDAETLDLVMPQLARLGLPADVLGFVQKSEAVRARKARRTKLLVAACLATVILVLLGFTAWNVVERRKAQSENVTSKARYLYAQALLNMDSGKAPQYLAASLRVAPLEETRNLANQVLWDPSGEETIPQLVLTGHTKQVTRVLWTPDGKSLISISYGEPTIRLWDLNTGACRVLEGHSAVIDDIALSPDGLLLASASDDKTVRLWNLISGKSQVLGGHEDEAWHVAFSPDGAALASASKDGTVRLWDVRTGASRILRGHQGPVSMCAFSPDGSALATASHDKTVRLWDVKTGIAKILGSFPVALRDLAFSPSGDLLTASSGEAQFLRLFDWRKGKEVNLKGTETYNFRPAFSQDGTWLACGTSKGGAIALWNLRSGDFKTLSGHRRVATRFAFLSDGRTLASSSWDDTVRIWDLATGAGRVLRGHRSVIVTLALSPDGRFLATGSADTTIRIWKIGKRPLPVLADPTQRVARIWRRGMAFSADSSHLAAGSLGNEVVLWDLTPGAARVLSGHREPPHTLLFSPEGDVLASASSDKTVRIWDVATGVTVAEGRDMPGVQDLHFFPDGAVLAFAGGEKGASVWNVKTGVHRALSGQDGAVQRVALSPDGTRLAGISGGGRVYIWDVQSGRCRPLGGFENKPTGAEASVCISPDGERVLAWVREAPKLALWNLSLKTPPLFLNISPVDDIMAFSPDGTTIATGSRESRGAVVLVDAKTGATRTLTGHDWDITSVVFSPGGKGLASTSIDGTARLWDLKTGASRVILQADFSYGTFFSPDGRLLATGTAAPTVYLWHESSDLFPGHKEPVWLVTDEIKTEEIVAALDRLTNLRYDPKSDKIEPLPFTGIPKEWQEEGNQ